MYYTGQSRDSAHIIQEQIDNTRAGKTSSIEAMHALKVDALAMKEAVLRCDLARYAAILNRSWTAKKQMAKGISNPEIDTVFVSAMASGALAGKISGAGGGGFMMFFVPPDRRMGLLRTLSQFRGQVMNFHFTSVGAQGWGLPG